MHNDPTVEHDIQSDVVAIAAMDIVTPYGGSARLEFEVGPCAEA